MRQRLRGLLLKFYRHLTPKPNPDPDLRRQNQWLQEQLVALLQQDQMRDAMDSYVSMVGELAEAKQMAGAGPWSAGPAALATTEAIIKDAREHFKVRESIDGAIGATGDINLMLANIGWRRETALSWLEFSRWGIQQIILICRLYYIKNPIVRRLIDVCAAYVFARGVEVTTSDETANEVLKDFFERNKKVFGQIALVESEKAKDYDGNLFWCFFSDRENKGLVDARRIDATEIQQIVTDPEDSDTPWYYQRIWTQKTFDPQRGEVGETTQSCWYPALGFDPPEKPAEFNKSPVMWDYPVYHRKCGYVGKWLFGCPRNYPMIDWAKEAKHILTACASLKQTLMQIGLKWTTKGGQQAIEGIKQQMQTTVGPQTPIWDTNPPAVSGASVVTGPGTQVEAFNMTGAGGNPDDVRQYKLMCAMVAGVPETFLADVSTGNLATATSLDRPTETIFLEKQEAWREDLVVIAKYVLEVSAGAPSGRLRESMRSGWTEIRECRRKRGPRGEVVYEAMEPSDEEIEIQVNFPAIREGDLKDLVAATVESITLNNKGGQAVGIDLKAGVIKLFDLLGIEDGQELSEKMFPEGKYKIDRSEQEIAAPIMPTQKLPGGEPLIDPKTGEESPHPVAKESARDIAGRPTRRIAEALRRVHEATAQTE